MSKNERVLSGSYSAGPSGALDPEPRVFDMSGTAVSSGFDEVIAVIDGDDDAVDEIKRGLERAFGPDAPMNALVVGQEEEYVSRLLWALRSRRKDASIAVAVLIGSETVTGASGGGVVSVLDSDGKLSIRTQGGDAGGEAISVGRSTIETGSFVVLMAARTAPSIHDAELKQTVKGSMTVEDAAAWLATVTSGKTESRTMVSVAEIQAVKPAVQAKPPAEAAKLRSLPPLHFSRRLGMVVALAAAVIVAAVAATGLYRTHEAAAPAPPTSLTVASVRPHFVSLAWKAAPGASGYLVVVAGQKIRNLLPSLTLDHQLAPGKTYTWRVFALYGKERGPSSVSMKLRVPPATAPAGPRVVRPTGVVPAQDAGSVAFCWTLDLPAKGYTLSISGGGHQYNHAWVPKSAVSRWKSGATCYMQKLPDATAYSWRVGAFAPGYYKTWSSWKHFSIAAAPTPTPTVLPTPAAAPTGSPSY